MDSNAHDKAMMRRCFALARDAVARSELPFSCIVAIGREEVSASTNQVRQDGDVTRHAEVVALVEAQKRLGRTSLEDCTLYTNVEPCALCSYAIREARIGKVVYGLSSPLMGGVTRWNILADERLSDKLPEVFAPPPVIVREMIGSGSGCAAARNRPADVGDVALSRTVRMRRSAWGARFSHEKGEAGFSLRQANSRWGCSDVTCSTGSAEDGPDV